MTEILLIVELSAHMIADNPIFSLITFFIFFFIKLCNKKAKDRATSTPLIKRDELRSLGRVSSFCSTSNTSFVTVEGHEHDVIMNSHLTPAHVNKCK
jgi:hypothetical protein